MKKVKRKIVFFCSTQYQIIVSLQIKNSFYKEVDSDIYILDHFKNSDNVVREVEKLSIFSLVKHVKSMEFSHSFSNNRLFRYLQKIKYFLSYKSLTKVFFEITTEEYSDIYLSFPDLIVQLGFIKLYNNNKNIKIHLFEDGAGGYMSLIRTISKTKKFFNYITGFGRVLDRYDDLYVFKPELMYETNIPIIKIPPIDIQNKDLKSTLNQTFSFKNEFIKEKIIFLDQPFFNIPGINEKNIEIAGKVLVNDYIVKLHPSSLENSYKNLNTFYNNSIPWEIICLNSDIEDKIIISFFSTAAISNKILFDKEPTIILLYDLPELSKLYYINDEGRCFIKKLKGIYKDSNKILIPKTINEVIEFLNKY